MTYTLFMKQGMIVAFFALFMSAAPLQCREITVKIPGGRGKSHVPAWDRRGTGPLPWQGIACADLTPDGRFIALGTIAPVGDPQVFVLDEHGAVIVQHNAGERWINEVAISPDGTLVSALITMPGGNSGDIPQLVSFANGKPAALKINTTPVGYNDFLHYGDHSNHLPAVLRTTTKEVVVAGQGQVSWVGTGPAYAVQNAFVGGNLILAVAASPTGRVVTGGAVSAPGRNEKSINLTVVDPGGKPRWQRPVSDDVAAAPMFAAGVFNALVSPYKDVKVWAPLSVAISADGTLVAAADYQGWQRLFERGDDYGLHFMPAKPVIQVYSADGALVRRCAPETFAAPGWYDLAFSPDNTRLLAYPHAWTSRGLGGQTRLPADDDARAIYSLDLATGDVTRANFPDAVADVAVGANGVLAVSCWNGNIYLRGTDLHRVGKLTDHLAVGVPCILRMSRDGRKLLAADGNGTVRLFADGKEAWKTDLNKVAVHGVKPWPKDEHLVPCGPGVWMRTGCRLGTDCGNLFIVEAPDGLLLIDPQSGLSNERYWAQMIADGLDPMRVKYILPTHEHGDHAPGAYLWRLLTGAQVVSSPEMAYILQHHLPIGTGYGFHPPQPIDILVDHDQDLMLAGLKVHVVRLPGHTYGSLGYLFEIAGTKYAALGDLIMPGGALGYSGAVDFSPKNVIDSLRKLEALKPDTIIGGHGGGDPAEFIAKGIAIGEATGWGKMPPVKPDPLFTFTQRNYLALGWRQPICAAAYGDMDGDGKPDVAMVTRENNVTLLKVYLNNGGKFGEAPDIAQPLPELTAGNMTKLRLVHMGRGKQADFVLCTGSQTVLLLAQAGQPAYRMVRLPVDTCITQAMVGDFNHDGRNDLLLGGRFVGRFYYALQGEDGSFQVTDGGPTRSNFDMQLLDVNDDKQDDLITSAGEIFLRQPDGKFPPQPTFQLELAVGNWSFLAAADFNGDGRPDIALLNIDAKGGIRVAVHYHTGNAKQPYTTAPNSTFVLPDAYELRDGPTIADWNGDGIPDLVLWGGEGAIILTGSPQGLDPKHTERVKLDYNPYADNRLGVADFTGNGKMDLASWGSTFAGTTGMYIWTR